MLDETGWEILRALQENARVSWSVLGRRVGLSAPAVAERVRRMEDAGLITGYRAQVDPARLGFAVPAIIRVSAPEEKCAALKSLIKSLPEVRDCHHVTGYRQLRPDGRRHLRGPSRVAHRAAGALRDADHLHHPLLAGGGAAPGVARRVGRATRAVGRR